MLQFNLHRTTMPVAEFASLYSLDFKWKGPEFLTDLSTGASKTRLQFEVVHLQQPIDLLHHIPATACIARL